MHTMQRYKYFWTAVAIALIVCWCPHQGRAAFEPITAEELKYSGPFELTGSIMEIDLAENMLVVAEYRIYVVDLLIGDEHLLTVLSDDAGEAIAFESFDQGQTVLVRGLQLPDGRVIAELIQAAGEQVR